MLKTHMESLIEKGSKFERAIVSVLADEAKAQGMTQQDFAKLFLGDNGTSAGKWTKIRDEKKKGNPQSLKIAEAFAASVVLGVEFNRLIKRAEVLLHQDR